MNNMEFTDKVMKKIELQMALREKRRAVWMTVLYSFLGVATLAGIFYALFDFGYLTLDTIVINEALDHTSSFFNSILNSFSGLLSVFTSHKLLVMIGIELIVFYAIGELLLQRRNKSSKPAA